MRKEWNLERLKLIGTEQHPLRASNLQNMVKCTMRQVISLFDGDESSGKAADTGSATHKAIAEWHRLNNTDTAAAIKAMHEFQKEYPLADLAESETLFRAYAKDERNKKAKVILIEEEVKITLPPAKEDETKQPIVIIGHLDQVREENGILKLYDIKTTTKPLDYALRESLYQMAAYCFGATILLQKQVEPGALILPRKYLEVKNKGINSPQGVYAYISWSLKDAPVILQGLKTLVAQMRKGEVWVNPGDYCFFCPARSIDYCVPKLQKLDMLKRGETK